MSAHRALLAGEVIDCFLVAAISTKVEPENLPGDSPSLSRLLPCFFFSPFAGSSPNHHVGSSRSVARKRPVTFSEDFVARLAQTSARLKPSSKIFAISLSSNARPPSPSHTLLCSSVLAPASFTLAVVFSWSSGFKLCKSGSVLPVSQFLLPPFSVPLVFPTHRCNGFLD